MAVKARWLIFLLALTATPLLANQPPGPQVLLVEISLLPLMMLLTLIGGGYAVLRRFNRRRWTVLKILGFFALLIFSLVSEGSAMLVALTFAIVALVRAVSMIVWGVEARAASPPEHLRGAQPPRLIAAGVALVAIAVFLTTTAFAFVGAAPWSDADRIVALREYVALRLALRTPPSPQRAALEKKAARYSEHLESMMGRFGDRHIRIDETGNHFVVYMKPNVLRTPFPPYDRFVEVPTYRADETGVIRMKLVHSRDELCPPDAPIIGRVNENDVRAVLADKRVD